MALGHLLDIEVSWHVTNVFWMDRGDGLIIERGVCPLSKLISLSCFGPEDGREREMSETQRQHNYALYTRLLQFTRPQLCCPLLLVSYYGSGILDKVVNQNWPGTCR